MSAVRDEPNPSLLLLLRLHAWATPQITVPADKRRKLRFIFVLATCLSPTRRTHTTDAYQTIQHSAHLWIMRRNRPSAAHPHGAFKRSYSSLSYPAWRLTDRPNRSHTAATHGSASQVSYTAPYQRFDPFCLRRLAKRHCLTYRASRQLRVHALQLLVGPISA